MPYITVSDEQAKLIANGHDGFEICDSSGRVLGYIDPPVPPEEIEIAKARVNCPGPTYSIDEVLAYLDSLSQGEVTGRPVPDQSPPDNGGDI